MTTRHFISTFLVVALLAPGMTLTQPAAPGSSGAWRISCVDCPKWFGELTDRSLRLDAAGHPHIAYGGDHLYYAYHDGNMWRYETADWAPGVGSSPSLDLNSSDQPHIAYHDSQNGDLKYAFRDGAGWHVMTVDTGAADSPVGETARLGLDSAGQPHIVYSDNSNYALKYAFLEPTGWRVEQVGHALYLGAPFSLAVSSTGVPHLCCADYDPVDELLVHAYREDTTWILEEIGTGFASPCSLALDADDHPYVIANKSGNESAVVHWTGGSWHTETIHWAGYQINGLSLALSADGFPHVSATFWYGAEPGYPVWQYRYRDQQGWHGLLSSDSVELGQTSLALDADGRPFVSYSTSEGLALVAFDGTTWRTETIDSSENVGRFSSLALDSASRPVVAYSGQSASMKVASWTGASWAVDDFPQFLRYGHVSGVSLALDSEDRPHVAHAWDFITTWEWTLYSLTYRYSDATGWHVETVCENQCCSLHRPSLALDTGDAPQITIVQRYSGYPMLHLRRIASQWESTWVDQNTDTISAMDLDEDGNPIIGYGQDDAVKVASYDTDGWRFEIVDAAGGSDVSLMLDASGSPRLSYANLTGDLMHAYRNAQGWHAERVATGVFQETSLAIDSSGYSHISAYDATHANLIYAYQNVAGWHMETVESSGQVGLGNSLALDAADQPIISFHDAVTGDLKLAVRETGPAPTATATPTATPATHCRYLPLVLRG